MRRTQNGDRQAFEALYQRYSSAVPSYLREWLDDAAEVEAVRQEVFLRAFRFAATYRYPQAFSTWLFTIARNVAINRGRPIRRPPVRNISELNLGDVDFGGDPHGEASKATDDPAKREQIIRVLSALNDLPSHQKQVIVLGVFQDMSYAQMEQLTGTRAVTLRSRMFHGLRALARMLGADGRVRARGTVEDPAGTPGVRPATTVGWRRGVSP